MALKSADHIQKILDLINVGTWATDAIWDSHKDDLDYRYVDLPDRSYRSGGFIVVEQGRKGLEPTGEKLYADEADFWAKALKHWPRPPFKKSHWTREYRRKDGDAIVRKFTIFAYHIFAVTREVNGVITEVKFYNRKGYSALGHQEYLIHEWTI